MTDGSILSYKIDINLDSCYLSQLVKGKQNDCDHKILINHAIHFLTIPCRNIYSSVQDFERIAYFNVFGPFKLPKLERAKKLVVTFLEVHFPHL